MGIFSRDPVRRALVELRRDADRQAQSPDRDTSEEGSARWHLADSALRALRRPDKTE